MAVLPRDVAAARARAALAVDETATFTGVNVPTLWIQARKDHLLRSDHVDDVRAARGAEVCIETILGPHTILQRRPRHCVAAIDKFLNDGARR